MQPTFTSPALVTNVLSDAAIKAALPGDVLKDRTIRGLQLRVFPESRSFYLYYRTKAGVQRRPKLGEYGAITLAQARKVAQEMLAEVAAGRDPSLARAEARAEPDFQKLWGEFRKLKGAAKKSADEDERIWERYLKPRFATKKLSHVKYGDVADMMQAMKATPYQANRCLSLLSTMCNFAVKRLEWLARNPCQGVVKFKEEKRKRYMRGDEAHKIAELMDAEAKENPASIAFLYLLILTGARVSEIANAQWDWVDGNVLHLPDSKTGAKSVYLPQAALDVLDKLPRTSGTITGIKSPKKLWGKIRTNASCADLRMHDLRHSFASAAISAGLTLAQIGELLGHKSVQTTQRYAHLIDEAAANAASTTADVIMLAMKKSPPKRGECEATTETKT